MSLPSPAELQLLSDNDWYVETDTQRVVFALNENTGCKVRGQHAHDFIVDKIEELKEDDSSCLTLEDRYQILQNKGYVIECESPLEIIDPNGDKITGECANFVLYANT